jgi:hypothetical protein
MKLENKNPERFIDGGERAVCSHVQAMRKPKGNNDCWIIGNDASGAVALLCNDCAAKMDSVTDWRLRYVLADDVRKAVAEAQAQGEEMIPVSDVGHKALADLQKVN